MICRATHVVEVKGKPDAMYGYDKRLSRMFFFIVNLGFQAHVMDLKVDYCNSVLGMVMYIIRGVQGSVVLFTWLTHQLYNLDTSRRNPDVKN
jgi:hypothetical protein